MNEFTQQGINAVKAGKKLEARRLLQQAVQKDPNDMQAWMWLSATVDSAAERADCLRQVLRIDPNNAIAKRGLSDLEPPPAAPEPAPEPPAPARPASLLSRLPLRPPAPAQRAEPTPDPLPPPVAKKTRPAKKRAPMTKKRLTLLLAGLGGLLVVGSVALGLVLARQFSAVSAAPVDPASLPVAIENTATPPANEPGSAATAVPTGIPLEPSATPQPTQTPAPTETFVPLGPSVQTQRERIQQQVADLRGLPVQTSVPFNIVSRDRADRYLRSEYVTAEFSQESERERLVLAALGLASPDYDTVTNRLNRMVDGMGGFYTLDHKEIFVIGLRFGAVENYIYAHQFTHALLDQNYSTAQVINGAGCAANSEPCIAMQAMVEGDAQLLMTEWSRKNANTSDYRDILLFRPASLALLEQNPPQFATENAAFGSERGLKFVNYLYNLGGWKYVDKAYANPPQTSEQIMHPKKYVNGEGALPVQPRPLREALGAEWQIARQNVLGEWYTYLLLGFGVDPSAQLDPDRASTAAAGWGGDSLTMLQNTSSGAGALAVHWAWDDEKEAGEFFPVLFQYMNERYRGARLDNIIGECWASADQVSCIYLQSNQTLWLQAPDAATIDVMKALYPEFP